MIRLVFLPCLLLLSLTVVPDPTAAGVLLGVAVWQLRLDLRTHFTLLGTGAALLMLADLMPTWQAAALLNIVGPYLCSLGVSLTVVQGLGHHAVPVPPLGTPLESAA